MRPRSALICAHPGHELRIYGWVALHRPRAITLTDGSGSHCCSRVHQSDRLLARAGVTLVEGLGQFPDHVVYAALLRRDLSFFLALADALYETLAKDEVECVVSDAQEGYNSVHDVCRLLAGAVVRRLRNEGRAFQFFDFAVVGAAEASSGSRHPLAQHLRLTDSLWARKLAAANDYPELASETNALVARFGLEALRRECLLPVLALTADDEPLEEPPYYEQHAERLAARGRFPSVIRYREHVLPLADAFHHYGEKGGLSWAA